MGWLTLFQDLVTVVFSLRRHTRGALPKRRWPYGYEHHSTCLVLDFSGPRRTNKMCRGLREALFTPFTCDEAEDDRAIDWACCISSPSPENHFTRWAHMNKKTKAQAGSVTCLRSHNQGSRRMTTGCLESMFMIITSSYSWRDQPPGLLWTVLASAFKAPHLEQPFRLRQTQMVGHLGCSPFSPPIQPLSVWSPLLFPLLWRPSWPPLSLSVCSSRVDAFSAHLDAVEAGCFL